MTASGPASPESLTEAPKQVTAAAHRPPGVWWAWVGVHGGSGCSTLARAIPGGVDLGRALPADAGWPDLPVVAVARSHAGGLEAAQERARWFAENPGAARVLGLVVVGDAPGRLPQELKKMIRLVEGGYPALWRVPFVQPWRIGQPPTPANTPRTCTPLLQDLLALAGVSPSFLEDPT